MSGSEGERQEQGRTTGRAGELRGRDSGRDMEHGEGEGEREVRGEGDTDSTTAALP